MSPEAPHRYGRALALTSGLTALVLLIGLAISRVADEALPYLTREPASVLDAAGYVGLLSNTTALVGVAASTSALLTWLVLGGTARSPWLWGGVLTGCLLVNDVFLVDDHYLTPTIDLRLTLSCQLSEVRDAVRTVQEFLKQQHCAENELSDCELALVEACNNAIQYAAVVKPI